MKFYRLYYIDRNGRKVYLCYVPTAQLGTHFCADPDECAIYESFDEAKEVADWYTTYCANIKGECLIEEYEEARDVSRNKFERNRLLLTRLVPRWEQNVWIPA